MPPTAKPKLYDGAVVFSEGVHYPADDDGHPILDRPLRWVEGSTYREAEDDDALHNDTHQVQEVEIEIGTVATPSGDAVEVTPEEMEAVQAFLDERRKGGAA